jgi:N-sulfoglucosamine sulfohydrolase
MNSLRINFLLFTFHVSVSTIFGDTPNILFIVSEDNGPEMRCYGTPIDTPHLDRLAQQGTLFRNAYVPQAGCSQSRAAFLTGLYPHQNGQIGLATWKYSMYSAKFDNVVKTLKQVGYRTGLLGKLHINPKDAFPFDFKAVSKSNFSRSNMVEYTRQAKRFIGASERPFYLQVNYPDAHRPFLNAVDNLPEKPLTGKDVVSLPYMGIDHPELRQQTADYYNCMIRLDTHIGSLLKALKDSGKTDNTVVVYIGDHGADLLRGKRTSYEGGVRIPMIIRWPGAKNGQDRKELVSTLDLYPTFCEIANTPVPKALAGRSLRSILHGEFPEWRKYLFTEYHVHSNHNPWPQRSVRDKRFKLIYNPLAGEVNPGYAFTFGKKFFKTPEAELLASTSETVRAAYRLMKRPPLYELYDLQEDPYEFNNLADEPSLAKTQGRLIAELKRWQKESGDAMKQRSIARQLFRMIQSAGTEKRDALDYKPFMQLP